MKNYKKTYTLSETFVNELIKEPNIKEAFIREGIIKEENCNHRFCIDDKYTSTCRICGEKKYKYENFGVKIVKGIFDINPEIVKDTTDTINYLFDNYRLDFARWFSFAEKEFDNFEKYTDKEIINMYEEQKDRKEIVI